jgi:hypothetical protein
MKSPRAHEIDRQAKGIFLSVLPKELVSNETQNPDYGKDYLLEISESQEMSGEQSFVQLKGTGSLVISRCGKFISFRLERKDAAYFVDKLKLPLFLVVVDVKRRTAYWLFTQQYLLEDIKVKGWRRKKKFLVRLPVANEIKDAARFIEAIRSARTYMAALQPAAIEVAIAAKKLSLESIDPRFEIQIAADERNHHFFINAKEPVDISLLFKGAPLETKRKLDDLFGRGLPFEFAAGDIVATGSSLFEGLFKDGGILTCNREFEATSALIARDAGGNSLSRLDNLQTVVRGGPLELRIESQLPGAPLVITSSWEPDRRNATLSVNICLERWAGQPILLLGYFEQIRAFADSLKDCTDVR